MKKILIIEDDPDLLYIFEVLLSELGHQLILTTTAPGLADIHMMLPDIILLDHHLSGSLGGDLCAELKSSSLTRHMTVILCSADDYVKKLAGDKNADGFIVKPFDIAELQAQINRFI